MITVNLSGNGFTVSGHSGYAEAGHDIVCAAVSSASELTANAITELAGASCDVQCDDNIPLLSLRILDDNGEGGLCRMFLKAFEMQLDGIAESYPDHVIIKKSEV